MHDGSRLMTSVKRIVCVPKDSVLHIPINEREVSIIVSKHLFMNCVLNIASCLGDVVNWRYKNIFFETAQAPIDCVRSEKCSQLLQQF